VDVGFRTRDGANPYRLPDVDRAVDCDHKLGHVARLRRSLRLRRQLSQ
jgi:hypothetical protein